MVEISLSGSGGGPGWETGRGYPTSLTVSEMHLLQPLNRKRSVNHRVGWQPAVGRCCRKIGSRLYRWTYRYRRGDPDKQQARQDDASWRRARPPSMTWTALPAPTLTVA
jgi:hypothetical protein